MVANIPEDLSSSGPSPTGPAATHCANGSSPASTCILAQAPWYGHGPGTATVNVGDHEFFFHNSYLAVRQEGGWLLLLLVLALMIVAFASLSSRSRTGDGRAIAAQAALIGILAMAVTLGEVLLELPTAWPSASRSRTPARGPRPAGPGP